MIYCTSWFKIIDQYFKGMINYLQHYEIDIIKRSLFREMQRCMFVFLSVLITKTPIQTKQFKLQTRNSVLAFF